MTDQSGTLEEGEITDQQIRAYAAGELSWRTIREQTGVEDFHVILDMLWERGLKLPRAPRDRPTKARAWLAEILAKQKGAY